MRETIPGVVQLICFADNGKTDPLSTELKECLQRMNLQVIQCTPDTQDVKDPNRRRFYMTAIPQQSEQSEGSNE